MRYSVLEESKQGTFVGNVATDLGLDVSKLAGRRFRIVSSSKEQLLQVNQDNGVLLVDKHIDREELCEGSSACLIHLKFVVDDPLEIHYVDVEIVDMNDHSPDFPEREKHLEIAESALQGARFALESARDPDVGINTLRFYRLSQNDNFDLEVKNRGENKIPFLILKKPLDREKEPSLSMVLTAYDGGEIFVKGLIDFEDKRIYEFDVQATDKGPVTLTVSYLNINSDDGILYSLKSFDFETLKTFQFQVVAKDSGTPSLSSNVTVNVFILDQNDNAPVILYPLHTNGSADGVEEVPRNVNAGHSVTKVRAYDADIGYNAWLSFSLQHATDASLFGLERYTGQIRTLRSFTETDEAQHKLVIVVKDNGNVSLSATATVTINAVEPKEAFAASDTKGAVQTEEENNVTFYLIITLGSVSALFLLSIIGLIVMQCSKPDYSTKYSRDSNYADVSGNGTLCHSIQYRSGDKRYMLVGPRMSIGSTIVPGSNANTLVVPDHRKRTSGEVRIHNV
ncbi:hypothetical protein JZ751_005344 [Albula glossodonta]|uniref:Cadherin domain-containing protein n=1 Tax=Albula glossodonta TaxID=121402 RepID=A0A8T2NCB0_9TELE|nr:hypothetical protein JZ751_005344 [Albula glossodonta]